MIKKFASLVLLFGVIVFNFGFALLPKTAMAANLTALSDTVSNLTASTAANHTIQFTTPTGVASGQSIILTFDNSTSVHASMTYTDIDLKDDGTDMTLAAAPTGATWGVVRTSPTVITFTNGTTAVAAGSVINIEIGTNATNQSTGVYQIANGPAGSTVLRISGSFTDTGAMSMSIITNSVVAVSAEVLSSLSFTVSQNAIYFGNLRTGGPCFAQNTNPGYVTCPTVAEAEAFNMTAGTNATSGYTLSVQGDTLTSGTNTITALASNTASNPGNEQFGLRATATGGSGVVQAPYAASGFAYTGTASTPATVASYTGPSATTTYSVRYLANISPTTEAGSYTASHTYVATGNY
jgi:hypothetical protein